MEWKFNNEAPIYQQIMEQIKAMIATGVLKAGDKLPSVRELAVSAGVNPNTMQKALSELERDGLLCSKRTSGRFVSDNKENADILQEAMMMECVRAFIENMAKLGYSVKDCIKIIEKYEKDTKDTSKEQKA